MVTQLSLKIVELGNRVIPFCFSSIQLYTVYKEFMACISVKF
uniref:Uncharacterized protein n=1 Tax=Nelumbo nucifera TaxID=4432 RepID=A0A822YM71_NELNU|nr:TPA_asm: hypothetical protein HUJ06_009279 [Nelumbo nucifera]